MFEGKHIHFSPVDNKPLCSYSSKLCRQRRLNGYAFCIRHILEDKSAPFKRCTYVTRNNNQICQNAIPTSQERDYCHSHMQVAGIFPKTERKIKIPAASKPTTAGESISNGKSDGSNSSSSNSASTCISTPAHPKKDPNAVFKFDEEEHSEIQWIPKGGSINGIVNGGKTSSSGISPKGNLKGKKEISFERNGISRTPNGNNKINGKINNNQSPLPNGNITKASPSSGVKPAAKGKPKPKNGTIVEITTKSSISPPIYNKSVAETVKPKPKLAEKKQEQIEIKCASENDIYFNQLKTLKAVQKSLTVAENNNNNNGKLSADASNTKNTSNNNNNNLVGLLNSVNAQKVPNSLFPFPLSIDLNLPTRKISESRQEFLARVRHAFKSQYSTVKNAAKDSDKNEKIWKRALRNSLLTCVVKDTSYCAHVIVQNDPKKYSDLNDNDLYFDIANWQQEKSSVSDDNDGDDDEEEDEDDENDDDKEAAVVWKRGKGKQEEHEDNFDKKVKSKLDSLESKPKAAKRNTATSSTENVEEIIKPSSNKRKARKIAPADPIGIHSHQSGSNILNGMNGSSLIDSLAQTITISNNMNKNSPEISSSLIDSKKRKFDLSNSSTTCNNTPSFRIPKTENSSSSFCDVTDIKMENGHGQMMSYNNFNGHINSSHPLLHPHSGSASTAPKNNSTSSQAQLQHLLGQPDLRSLAKSHNNHQSRNQGMDTVLNSVGSSDMGTSDGVITDASFDSTFDHSVSSQQDCEFSDDDLEKSLEFQIDPETEHQASRLLEDNELTEDDLNELFPETSNKLGRSDLADLGVDFSTGFDTDIDYSLFANIFPFSRSSQSESISVSNQY